MKQKIFSLLLYVLVIFFFRLAGEIVIGQPGHIAVKVLIIYTALIIIGFYSLSLWPKKEADHPLTISMLIYVIIPVLYWYGLSCLAILHAYDPETYLPGYEQSLIYISVLATLAYVFIPAIFTYIKNIRKDRHILKSLHGDSHQNHE